MSRIIAPYGSWQSPITSELLTTSGPSLSQLCISSNDVYWAEGRPLEAGRVVVVKENGDVTPQGFNVRTRVHEYGGGAFVVHRGRVFFSNFKDQRIYRQDGTAPPQPITPEPHSTAGTRYADARITPDGLTLVCVRERHESEHEVVNELVAIPTDGSSQPQLLSGGHDFYSSPRLSPDGRRLLWLSWDHPDMPWDATELWTADFHPPGRLSTSRKVAGGSDESVFQPEWSPEGVIHYVSDATGWWNLYSEKGPLAPMEAEFGVPQWVFGLSRYGFLNHGRVACAYSQHGLDRLAILDVTTGALQAISLPYTAISDLRTDGSDRVFLIAASAAVASEIVELHLGSGRQRTVKSSMNVRVEAEDVSTPQPLEYPTTRNRTAHALFYRPANKSYSGPEHERPPLLVVTHGGPTSETTSAFKLALQYWTNRGFAVADVNYGGSTGYGRAYRKRLNGLWGIVDVEDCIEAARYLSARGEVDVKRLAIRGGSAGGYTTLCALVFHKVFAAGASHYGVGDLVLLASDSHKFESRYLDGLVGPYPAAAETYRARSPIHFAERISCPIILFQGLDDKVVPPNQAETFVAALRAKGLPCEYLSFPNEGHGFRQAATIRRVAEAELEFYARIFGFHLPNPDL